MVITNIIFTAAIVIALALSVVLIVRRADKQVSDNQDRWYNIIVYRMRQNGEYSYEITIKKNSTKQSLVRTVLNEIEYSNFQKEFNIEPLEHVNKVIYYALYANVICDVTYATKLSVYLMDNHNAKVEYSDFL